VAYALATRTLPQVWQATLQRVVVLELVMVVEVQQLMLLTRQSLLLNDTGHPYGE
jgi:hypothetical protein